MLDILIDNAYLADPKSCELFYGSVGIEGGKIARITRKTSGEREKDSEKKAYWAIDNPNSSGIVSTVAGTSVAHQIIDAKGAILSPGFIDVHSHVDGQEHSGELSLQQGITTCVGGNCGLSAVNMHHWMNKQNNQGFYINQAQLYGHSMSLRRHLGLTPYEVASRSQIDQMVLLAEQAMEDGAAGISFGLDYSPATSTEEFHRVGGVAARYGRIVAVDTRMNHSFDLSSIAEIAKFSVETGAKTLISHFVYQYGNRVMEEALDLVRICRQRGLEMYIDSGLYKDWSTYIGAALFDQAHIESSVHGMANLSVCTGKYKGQKMTPEIYKELRKNFPNDSVVCKSGDEENVYKALKAEFAIPSTDAGEYNRGEGHPQAAGSFPRFFQKMVRERQELTINQAVYKATLQPAEVIGLARKGRLEVGYDADLVVFDVNRIEDKADFPDCGVPDERPEGIHAVIVNGNISVLNGLVQNKRAGRIVNVS